MDRDSIRDLAGLRAEVKARGWDVKPTGRILVQLAFHVGVTLAGLAMLLLTEDLRLQGLAIVIAVLGTAGVSTNTHSSAHYATSDRKWVNDALTLFGYPFFIGMSGTYWRHKHNRVHHSRPNVIGQDDDINLLPFFAFTEKELNRTRGLHRFYLKFQWLIVLPSIAFNYWNIQYYGLKYLRRMLTGSSQRKGLYWLDLAAVGGHWLCWVLLPLFFLPLESVVAFTLIRTALGGYVAFFIFAPGHFPAEASAVEIDECNRNYILLQTSNSLNFDGGAFGRLLCSGLDYHIEHHLFPEVAFPFYRAMSPMLRDFCAKHGYPYRTLGWGEAIWKSYLNFVRPKPVIPSLTAPEIYLSLS